MWETYQKMGCRSFLAQLVIQRKEKKVLQTDRGLECITKHKI